MGDKGIQPALVSLFKSSRDWYVHALSDELGQISKQVETFCDSPIEQLFLYAMYVLHFEKNAFGLRDGGRHKMHVRRGNANDWESTFRDRNPEITSIDLITTQAPIGSHRVDFLIARYFMPSDGTGKRSPLIIVECDGHDFHERTKEQAQSDKSRDRELQEQGYFVLRFTGSEIWRDPRGCAIQLNSFIQTHLDREEK